MKHDSRVPSPQRADALVTDPKAATTVGGRLDARLGDCPFDQIVVWNEPESAVLAHVIGGRRGVPVARATEIEGLVELIDPLSPGGQKLVLARAFSREGAWRALVSLVSRAGAHVAAVAAIDRTAVLDLAAADGHTVVFGADDGGAEETV